MVRHQIKHILAVFTAVVIILGISSTSYCQTLGDPTKVDQFQRQLSIPVGPYAAVNTATGKLSISVPIVGWKSKAGTGVSFSMQYSAGDDFNWPGSPALGWRHSYHSWAIESSPYPKIMAQWNDPTGIYNWNYNSQNLTYDKRYPGNPHDIALITGGYQTTAKDQTKYEFKQQVSSYYYMTKETDTHGNISTINYRTQTGCTSQVSTVQDASGRSLTFTWQDDGGMICTAKMYTLLVYAANVDLYFISYSCGLI